MAAGSGPPDNDELEGVTHRVVHLVTREHALSGNQLFELASHLQRLAVHRITEERLARMQRDVHPPREGE